MASGKSKAAEGTFEQLMKGVEPKLVTLCKRLRKLVREIDPETVESVRLGDNAATYGVGPKKMTDGYAYVMPLREYVNLGFYAGASLPDPQQLLEGTGKALRHVKVRTVKDLQKVRPLVEAAVKRKLRSP